MPGPGRGGPRECAAALPRRPAGAVAVLLVVVTLAVVAGPAPAGTTPPAAGGRSVASVRATCADPTDCRLWEAAAGAGIAFGMASVNGSDTHKATLVAESSLSVNHEFSWAGIEPDRGVWDFSKADDNYGFAVDHGLEQVAMHFAWDQRLVDDMPGWVADITDPDELRDVLRTRARTIFDRYPELDRIDVINEPFETLGSTLYENHFFQVLGPDYIDELFGIVEAEAPADVELFVNEGGIEYQPDKAAALVDLVGGLVASGRRVDSVGLQTHLSVGDPNWPVLYDTMRQLEALGVRPWISEVDVPVPATVPDRQGVQDERYRRVVEICLAIPSCDTINVWGVSDADTWYDWGLYPDLDPLLFDEEYRPKSSYRAVRDALLAGRPAVPGPPGFLLTRAVRHTSGEASVAYGLQCSPTEPVTEVGYAEISGVTRLFVTGNPIRIPMAADVRWSPAVRPGGTIDYEADLTLDLGHVAALYREETARPAVGLGGYLPVVDGVWLELVARPARISIPIPEGTRATGTPTVSATAGAASVTVEGSTIEVEVDELVGDSRAPRPAVGLHLSWSVVAPSGADDSVVRLGPPTLDLGLEAHLGVDYQGVSVFGGTIGPMSCAAAGEVAVLDTAVSGTGPTVTTTGASDPPAALPAIPIPAQPSFTG